MFVIATDVMRLLNGRVVLAAALVLLLVAAPLEARNNLRDAFFSAYPGAVGKVLDTVPSRQNHCGVCHYDFTGAGPRNPYGVRVGEVLGSFPSNPNGRRQAILSIENEDSDGDGFTTLVEVTDLVNYVNTPTFPGLTPGNVGNVSNVTLSDIQGHLVPSIGDDTTPPEVTVLYPNGGETLTGNEGVTVQWIATDAGGIAFIDLYLSLDNGATFQPMLKGLPNTGSRTWFPPNRPSNEAIFRVVATDNAFNVGHDDSDAPFTVVSPPGGTVPTTLRDFDMPGSQPFEAGNFVSPTDCAACHGNYSPAVEPYHTWQGSMMAHASIDPLFKAAMTVANQDAPDSGDLCLRCHVPQGWLQGRSIPTSGTQFIPADMVGVSCNFCHRLVDPIYKEGNPAEDLAILANLLMAPDTYGNGMFVVDPNDTRRGPRPDATSGHPVIVSPFHQEAAFCGTCHDVSNPAFYLDPEGNYVPNAFDAMADGFGPHTLMPVERTYSEWLHSAYNTPEGVYAPQFGGNKAFVATCQDCHMRSVTGKACNIAEAPVRNDLAMHDMTGGSTWLPGLLHLLHPGEIDTVAVQDGILRARYMLQNAAQLAAVQEGTQLKVTVTNDTGHKLPTGYPEGRRIWISVKLFDAGMNLIQESGAYDPDTGVLTQDDAKVYEAKPGLDALTASLVGVPEGPSFHFVLNNKIFKDNRIPPRGFTNAAFATFGGTPVAYAYEDGQYWDDTLYTVIPGAASAQVNLYYQSTSKEYVEFLRDQNVTDDAGQILYDLWNEHGKCPPELMASVTLSVFGPVVAADLDGDSDVDLDDFAILQACTTGAKVPYDPQNLPPGCNLTPDAEGIIAADFNRDGSVDQQDFAVLQRCYSGENVPADPSCAD